MFSHKSELNRKVEVTNDQSAMHAAEDQQIFEGNQTAFKLYSYLSKYWRKVKKIRMFWYEYHVIADQWFSGSENRANYLKFKTI